MRIGRERQSGGSVSLGLTYLAKILIGSPALLVLTITVMVSPGGSMGRVCGRE